jgi:protein gp37
MAEDTEIAWCDSTFNPWIGCTKVGPGCDNCYAEADFDLRKHRAKWGPGNPRSRTSPANWKKPLQWDRQHEQFFAEQGRRRRVFCASLADVFDNEVPEQWRADLFALIDQTPNLDWLLLTKRIGNVGRMIPDWWSVTMPPNVWLGATVVNQEEADRDIPKLLQVKARVRWLSMEPLLGPVDLRQAHMAAVRLPRVDWVVVGGESGPNARPMHGSWAYDLHDQCESAGVPFLFKQWGEWVNAGAQAFGTAAGEVRHIRSDGTFWSEDDDALQDECADVLTVVRVGKKAAGRDLGGVQHDGYPEAKP